MEDDEEPPRSRKENDLNDFNGTESAFVNLAGDYRYLKQGYFESVDAEVRGMKVYPTPEEAVNAYIVPICLERAKRNGIPIPDYAITREEIKPPALVYPINPFMSKFSVVQKSGSIKRIVKSMTRNNTYPICVQKLDGTLREFSCILGETTQDEFASLAKKIWDLFHLPLCRVRVISNAKIKLSAIEPLELHELKRAELKLLRKANAWQK